MQAGGGGKLKPLANIVGKMFNTLVIMKAMAGVPGLRARESALIAAPLITAGSAWCCIIESARRMTGPAVQLAMCSLLQRQFMNKSSTEAQ